MVMVPLNFNTNYLAFRQYQLRYQLVNHHTTGIISRDPRDPRDLQITSKLHYPNDQYLKLCSTIGSLKALDLYVLNI